MPDTSLTEQRTDAPTPRSWSEIHGSDKLSWEQVHNNDTSWEDVHPGGAAALAAQATGDHQEG